MSFDNETDLWIKFKLIVEISVQ